MSSIAEGIFAPMAALGIGLMVVGGFNNLLARAARRRDLHFDDRMKTRGLDAFRPSSVPDGPPRVDPGQKLKWLANVNLISRAKSGPVLWKLGAVLLTIGGMGIFVFR